MDLKRIEAFTINKRSFIYFDLSKIKSNNEFTEFTNMAKDFIQNYKPESVYSIANIEGILFDSQTKEILADWLDFNSKYVVYGSVINVDGIKKIMFNSVLNISNRKNIKYFNTRHQAVEWLSEV